MESTFLINFSFDCINPNLMEEKKINVLYVDDEPNNITSFKAAFRRSFNIYTAESADEGMRILDTEKIDVILSDQRMPRMTGIEFFQSILTTHPEPIRILITGYTDINAVIDAINLGQVYKYLSKPWNEEDVKNFIYKAYEVLDLRQKNRELTEKLIEANEKLEFLARQNLLS
jgi:response regulator RpfG family c-di-GMP phosphodiesterase